ncbi:MAG TPA: hypothetical protein VLM11_19215 [Streptosporangiaceae bacterium]|nr:hypothetical protein [Streptosporangiaceae bacterium]
MAGVTAPSAGRVTGRPRAGYVPERFPGGLAFSARHYLMHMSRIHSLVGAAVPPAVDQWLERLGATEFAGSPLRTLSKGMCQKVAVAQAFAAPPPAAAGFGPVLQLVLDEAWTGLDLGRTVDARRGRSGPVVRWCHCRLRRPRSRPDGRPAAAAALRAQALASGFDWSAALLVPVVALLTRSMLTAEPAAARACVAAARGPRRAQLATLITAVAGGAGLGLAGVVY